MNSAYQTVRAELVARRDKIDETIRLLDEWMGAERPKPDAPILARAPRPPRKVSLAANGHDGPAAADAEWIVAKLGQQPDGVLSRELREELGRDAARFKTLIAGLIEAGKIVKYGERNGTGYRLA